MSAGNVQFLVEKKLRPLGVVALPDGSTPKLRKLDPLLGLKLRTALVPERRGEPRSRAGSAGCSGRRSSWSWRSPRSSRWTAGCSSRTGSAAGLRTALYDPALLLLVFGGVVLATGFHELGHASACRYGGARPGVLGAGIYLVWPVFYCDVTDAYRLGKARAPAHRPRRHLLQRRCSRSRCGGLYAVTGFEPLLLLILLQHLAIVQQLLPFLRLDGYYVISDLTGVPDILTRIGPILKSLRARARARQARRRAEAVGAAWSCPRTCCVLIPLLLGMLRAGGRGRAAAVRDGLRLGRAPARPHRRRRGRRGARGAGVLQLVALRAALPRPGGDVRPARARTAARLGRLGVRQRRPHRWPPSGIGAAALALAAWTWWPNGDYEPLRAGERITLSGDATRAVGDVPSGRAAFTPERERRYGDEPTERERESGAAPRRPGRTATRPLPRALGTGRRTTVRPGASRSRWRPPRGEDAPAEDPAAAPEDPAAEDPSATDPQEAPPSGEWAPEESEEAPPEPAQPPPEGGTMQAPQTQGSAP